MGAEAAQIRFKMLLDAEVETGVSPSAEHLMPLKQFRWLLEGNQKVALAKWLRDLARSACNQGRMPQLIDDDDDINRTQLAIQIALPSEAPASSSKASPAPKQSAKAKNRPWTSRNS